MTVFTLIPLQLMLIVVAVVLVIITQCCGCCKKKHKKVDEPLPMRSRTDRQSTTSKRSLNASLTTGSTQYAPYQGSSRGMPSYTGNQMSSRGTPSFTAIRGTGSLREPVRYPANQGPIFQRPSREPSSYPAIGGTVSSREPAPFTANRGTVSSREPAPFTAIQGPIFQWPSREPAPHAIHGTVSQRPSRGPAPYTADGIVAQRPYGWTDAATITNYESHRSAHEPPTPASAFTSNYAPSVKLGPIGSSEIPSRELPPFTAIQGTVPQWPSDGQSTSAGSGMQGWPTDGQSTSAACTTNYETSLNLGPLGSSNVSSRELALGPPLGSPNVSSREMGLGPHGSSNVSSRELALGPHGSPNVSSREMGLGPHGSSNVPRELAPFTVADAASQEPSQGPATSAYAR
uniref:Uncharacterized protein n=1 Tax=Globodera rostochiensis TaxID=31243 RepID=A0A914HVD8_GLORO